MRDPVEDETPAQNADVQAERVNLENAESLVGDEVVDLSSEVVLLSVEHSSDVDAKEDGAHGEEGHNADVDVRESSAVQAKRNWGYTFRLEGLHHSDGDHVSDGAENQDEFGVSGDVDLLFLVGRSVKHLVFRDSSSVGEVNSGDSPGDNGGE